MKTSLKLLGAVLLGALALPAFAHGDRDDERDKKKVKRAHSLVLTNGRIHTMDAQNAFRRRFRRNPSRFGFQKQ